MNDEDYGGSLDALTWAIEQRTDTVGAKLTLLLIAAQCGTGYRLAMKQDRLAELVGVEPRSLRRYITELQRLGMLESTFEGGAKPPTLRVLVDTRGHIR